MFRLLSKSAEKATLTKTATWLAQHSEKEAAKKIVFEMIKEDPKDKSMRVLYAKIEKDLLANEDSSDISVTETVRISV